MFSELGFMIGDFEVMFSDLSSSVAGSFSTHKSKSYFQPLHQKRHKESRLVMGNVHKIKIQKSI